MLSLLSWNINHFALNRCFHFFKKKCLFFSHIFLVSCTNNGHINWDLETKKATIDGLSSSLLNICNAFDVWLTVHHSSMWNKKPTRCNLVLYLFLLYKLLNMFRATLCPSSETDDLVVFFHVWCNAVAV